MIMYVYVYVYKKKKKTKYTFYAFLLLITFIQLTESQVLYMRRRPCVLSCLYEYVIIVTTSIYTCVKISICICVNRIVKNRIVCK